MKDLIDVFRMSELSSEVRVTLIRKLGRAINDSYCMDITGELVDELVNILEGDWE